MKVLLWRRVEGRMRKTTTVNSQEVCRRLSGGCLSGGAECERSAGHAGWRRAEGQWNVTFSAQRVGAPGARCRRAQRDPWLSCLLIRSRASTRPCSVVCPAALLPAACCRSCRIHVAVRVVLPKPAVGHRLRRIFGAPFFLSPICSHSDLTSSQIFMLR